jgi:hypothetical protein
MAVPESWGEKMQVPVMSWIWEKREWLAPELIPRHTSNRHTSSQAHQAKLDDQRKFGNIWSDFDRLQKPFQSVFSQPGLRVIKNFRAVWWINDSLESWTLMNKAQGPWQIPGNQAQAISSFWNLHIERPTFLESNAQCQFSFPGINGGSATSTMRRRTWALLAFLLWDKIFSYALNT